MSECIDNFLSSGKFLVNLSRLPGVDFYCQTISTPDISINSTDIKYIVGSVVETDTHISYGDLSLTFIVDKSLKNYNEVLKWMKLISPDEDFIDTAKFIDKTREEKIGFDYTDIELIFNQSQNDSKQSYIFKNCVPQALSGLEFNVSEDLFITANLTFKVPQLEVYSK